MAVLLSAVRLLLPTIDHYRAEIIASISELIGNPIEIDNLSAGMNGLRPEIVLSGVKVIDPKNQQVLLGFKQLRAGLNLKQFILAGHFQPRWVTIKGAKLSIRRKYDGSLRVIGIDGGGEMPKWIFEEGYFELLDSDVDWQDMKHSGVLLEFAGADIRLLNVSGRHKVAIDVQLPAAYGKSLSLRLDYRGDVFVADCCDGTMYTQASEVHYGSLLEGLSFGGYSIPQGHGDFQVWSTWEKSSLVGLVGDVNFHDGSLSHQTDDKKTEQGILAVRSIAGWFQWERHQQNWNFAAHRFLLNLTGDPWPLTDFGLNRSVDQSQEKSSFHFFSSYLKLEDLKIFLKGLKVLAADNQQILQTTAPRGEFFDLHLGLYEAADERSWFVCGRFENLGFTARQRYPGAKNLAGTVCGDQSNGRFQLDASEAEIDLPEVFRIPIDLTLLKGIFNWNQENQVWKIHSDRIIAENPVLATESRVFLELPLEDGEPFLDVQVAFNNGDAPEIHRYLPVAVLEKPLIEWLDAAFLSGTVTRGGALFRGPIFSFPFRRGDGVFETLFYTKDVDISYHPDWPLLKTDEAEVRFFQAGMDVLGEQGSILGADVSNVRVSAVDFEFDDYLIVTGTATGTIDKSINFIKKSPLAPLYEPLLEYVSIRGENRIGLNLKVPIATELDDILVKGTIALKKSTVEAFGLEMDQVHGKLNFTEDRIVARGVQGVLLGSPVQVDMSDNSKGQSLQIRGSIGADTLSEKFPGRFWKYIKGDTDYVIGVQIPQLSEKLYADISLQSDMKGLSLNLPKPLLKAPEIPRQFHAKTHLEPGAYFPVELAYGSLARAQLNLHQSNNNFHLKHGKIELGRGHAEKPMTKGLNLYVSLERFSFSPWQKFLTSSYREGSSSTPSLNSVDFQTEKLMLSGVDVGPFDLKMHRNGDFWEGVTSSNFAQGKFSGKKTGESASGMDLNFKYLKIPKQNIFDQPPSKEKFHWDPGSIPSLKLRADRFFWKEIDYGSLELETHQKAHSMKIDHLKILGDGLDVNLGGYWTSSGIENLTSISGEIEIEDLGKFLTKIGKANVIKDTRVNAYVDMNWKDPLYDLNVGTLSGIAQIEFGQGRLLTVEPGIGRVFGLFNLDGLKNLLKLDFGQLFGQGLAYEGVKSSFQLSDGRAKIVRLMVDALPAEIIVSGSVDLAEEELDDIVTVVPKGMVAAGASMILTQELPGSAVDGLINRQYKVTGKWDNPEILRLPGSGKPL